ncbi:intermembrane phospholipid transport protein YdbH family protein [Sneathiella glossodoripedis]|uniref:intermembrane phospholipid transport protein YdbH family protein n=1 Tax=Sneathiella glossodoripedis TaxID=418853 RepID=UPI000472DB4E|nr:YdbH domain-containing protein [Sneathiella glossodoripedis]
MPKQRSPIPLKITSLQKIAAVFAFIVLVLGSIWFARISIAQFFSTVAFDILGIEEAELQIVDLNFTKLQIKTANLSDVIQASDVTVEFSPADLVEGVVRKITVSNLSINISDLQHPAFEKLMSLASTEQNISSPQQVLVPQIQIGNFHIFEDTDARSIDLTGSASLGRDGNIDVNALASGHLQASDNVIALSDGKLSVSGSATSQEFAVKLAQFKIGQRGENPLFTPMQLDGEAAVSSTHASLNMQLATQDQTKLIELSGELDPANLSGEISYVIDDLVFSENGLQPFHLFPELSALPKISAVLSGTGQGELTADQFEIDMQNSLKRISVSLGKSEISAPLLAQNSRLQIVTTGEFNIIDGSVSVPTVAIHAGGEKILAKNFTAKIANSTKNQVQIAVTGVLENPVEVPVFPASKVDAKINLSNNIIGLIGTVKSINKGFGIVFDARQNLQTQTGSANFQLPLMTIGQGGASPSQINSLLAFLDGKLSAQVAAKGKAEWDRHFSPEFELSANLSEGSYQDKNIVFSATSFAVSAPKFRLDQKSELTVSNFISRIGANDNFFDVTLSEMVLEVGKDFTGMGIEFENAKLHPLQENPLKPVVYLSTSSKTDFKVLQLNSVFRSDLIGDFLTAEGRYDFDNATGEIHAQLPTVQFGPNGLKLSSILKEPPENMTIEGGVGANIVLSVKNGITDGQGELVIDDLSIEQEGSKISGLNGTIDFAGLIPLKTAPAQYVEARQITAGIPLQEPKLTFAIEQTDKGPVLKIDRMIMNLFGGAAEINNEVIDPSAKVNSLKVYLTNLSVEQLVALGDLQDVVASGSLKGVIPLQFDGEKLIIPDALLESEGPGRLSVKSEAARQALLSGGSQTKLFFDILENFNYSELSLIIRKPASGEDVVTLHTKGSNPEVENSRPVILNVNLSTNLDRIFGTILDGYRLSEQALRATLKGRK